MPEPTLYFLRSSEQKITTDILHYSMRLDVLGKTLDDFPELNIFEQYYGLTNKDLGLYAMHEHTLAGAVWIRLLKDEDGAKGFINVSTPILNIAVKPEFRNKGIGSIMLEQFLLEAGAMFEQISVSVLQNSHVVKFYEKFGFVKLDASDGESPIDGSKVFTMTKELVKKEVIRPTDGYDPQKWID